MGKKLLQITKVLRQNANKVYEITIIKSIDGNLPLQGTKIFVSFIFVLLNDWMTLERKHVTQNSS